MTSSIFEKNAPKVAVDVQDALRQIEEAMKNAEELLKVTCALALELTPQTLKTGDCRKSFLFTPSKVTTNPSTLTTTRIIPSKFGEFPARSLNISLKLVQKTVNVVERIASKIFKHCNANIV